MITARVEPRVLPTYLRALESDPADARVFYEYDQLRKKMGGPPHERLATLLSKKVQPKQAISRPWR